VPSCHETTQTLAYADITTTTYEINSRIWNLRTRQHHAQIRRSGRSDHRPAAPSGACQFQFADGQRRAHQLPAPSDRTRRARSDRRPARTPYQRRRRLKHVNPIRGTQDPKPREAATYLPRRGSNRIESERNEHSKQSTSQAVDGRAQGCSPRRRGGDLESATASRGRRAIRS